MKHTLGAEQLPSVSEHRGVRGNNSQGAAWVVSERVFEPWAVLTPENDSLGNGTLVTAASEAAHVDRDKQLSFPYKRTTDIRGQGGGVGRALFGGQVRLDCGRRGSGPHGFCVVAHAGHTHTRTHAHPVSNDFRIHLRHACRNMVSAFGGWDQGHGSAGIQGRGWAPTRGSQSVVLGSARSASLEELLDV